MKPLVILGVTKPAARKGKSKTGSALLEAMLTRGNLQKAWKRVKANKGSAGIDGLDIAQTGEYLKTHCPKIREGTYRPSPVRRVTIPKPDGGQRELGTPTVLDRLIQQALLQVLQHPYGEFKMFREVLCRQCVRQPQ